MVGSTADTAVFDFENIMPQLDFLPIAARRALDHAGLRLSLEAWRSLSLDDRCQLVAAGAADLVDGDTVAAVVRRAAPPAQRIEVVGDPDPLAPPDGLLRLLEPVPLDARQWARLRALDRYALAHVHRRSIARNDPSLIQAAYEDIVMGHLRSLRPPAPEAGGRERGPTTPRRLDVPPPPLLPRTELGSMRGVEPVSSPRRPEVRSLGGTTPPRPRRALATPPAGRAFDAGLFAGGPESPPFDVGSEPPLFDVGSEPPPIDAGPGSPYAPAAGPLDEIPELHVPSVESLSTHLSESGSARMVDVGAKPVTDRRAVASAVVHMRRETFRRLAQRDTPKGDVLAAARIAGIQAAKRTSELIPLCHLIALTSVEVHLELDEATSAVQVTAIAQAADRTGVEMEALVAASIAGLTIYDMLKGIDRDMRVDDVKLLEKSGGKTGHYRRRDT